MFAGCEQLLSAAVDPDTDQNERDKERDRDNAEDDAEGCHTLLGLAFSVRRAVASSSAAGDAFLLAGGQVAGFFEAGLLGANAAVVEEPVEHHGDEDDRADVDVGGEKGCPLIVSWMVTLGKTNIVLLDTDLTH